ncbi:MAG: hypothetical protein UD103_08665 [Bacteroidales bacterium]|nr:hypothetical protein [Bacteroidales bacterium]
MKNLFKILVFSLIILPFTSCVDEEDFDFDSLSQTTITPSINAPLINLEVQLNDFLDLEQLSDTANGFEIIQVNEANDSYLEFVFSMKDTFDISSFIQQIEGKDDVQVNLSDISIPDLSDLGLSSTDLPEFYFSFPDQSVAAEDLSIEVEEFENGVRVDSVQILSGGLIIENVDALPLNAYIELTSSCIKNKVTGELFSETIQISNVSSSIEQQFDLSNYTISLKDSTINNENKQFIDLRYRLIFDIASNNLFQGGNYDINLNVSLLPFMIDAIFGDFGDTEFNIKDAIALDFFKDSLLNAITSTNSIDFEKFTIDLSTSTNIGVDMNIYPNIYTITSQGNTYNVFNNTNSIRINGADILGETAYTNNIVLESDASAIEVFPDSLIYDVKFDFKDEVTKTSNYDFISPDDAFVTLDAKAKLPLKAKLNNLHYDTEFDAFNFIEEMNYLKSTSLQFFIESTFPAELSINLYLVDSNQVIFDTLLASPLKIGGAVIDNEGHLLAPTAENIKITLDDSKYDSLKKAKKIKLSAILNTSKDEGGEQRYVRFSNDAKIKVKASVSATGNITF